MATATARLARPRMNLWRLEWLRLIRTPRALALGAVFVFFGLLEPVLTRYQSQIFRHVGNGVRISFPPATPAAGVSGYVGELSGTGLIVVVVVAAGAFTRMLCGAVYLAYAVAVTALAAAIVRGTLGTVGIALGVLFLLPIAGVYARSATGCPARWRTPRWTCLTERTTCRTTCRPSR